MTILPSTYLGSVEWYAHALREECIIDLHEHYIKRSERNRGRIMTAGGVMELTVNLERANRPRTPMCDVRIDYSKRWQHQHWIALVSAYKSSPYFDFYAEWFEPFYSRRYDFLVDYNVEIASTTMRLLGAKGLPTVSECYVTAADEDCDLRPKRRAEQKNGSTFTAEPYIQVFAENIPFAPNLSVIDLLCAEGPNSSSVLARCLP